MKLGLRKFGGRTKSYFKASPQRGALLIGILVIGMTLSIIAVTVMSFTSSTYSLAVRGTYAANAGLIAEAGIETSLNTLNGNSTFTGYSAEQEFFNNSTQGKGVYTTVITDTSSNAKVITSTGKVYRYGTTTNPVQTRKVRVTVVGTAAPGYSVYTGPGGLILSGAGNITNADVYVAGGITMTGGARIGTAFTNQKTYVGNMRCPTGATPGATYPQVCAPGVNPNPISFGWSTYIYGTVCANDQISTGPNPSFSNIQPGSAGGQGLVAGCVPPTIATPPVYDRATHLAAVSTTSSGTNNTYVCNNWPFSRNWPANLELTGDVSVAGACLVNLKGNVHITGNLNLGGAAIITVDNTVGTNRPVILVDGTITMGGAAVIVPNSSGTGLHFISTKTNAACSPACTSLTGNELKASQNLTTVTVGGGVSLPGMIFQSQWGKIVVNGSGNMGSALGQTVDLSGAGTVLFGTTLSSGTTSWSITGYQRIYQ